MKLSPGWYVAERSSEITKRPVSIELFHRTLEARRDARGEPVLLDGERPLPAVERYGYVWAWYGTPAPTHPLPSFPRAEDGRHASFQLALSTTASVQRILESQYDADHLVTLHKVKARSVSVIQSPAERLLDPQETTFSARMEAPLVPPAGVMKKVMDAFGVQPMRALSVTTDTFSSGSVSVAKMGESISVWVLIGLTPAAPGKTIIHELVMLEKSGHPIRDALAMVVWKAVIRATGRQDVTDLNRSDDLGDPFEGDETILDFRRAYERSAAVAA